MSDPMTTPPPEAQPRKNASPLVWILVLIALVAFAWYFHNRQSAPAGGDAVAPVASTGDAMTPAAGGDVEKAPARKAPAVAKKPKAVARATSPSREVALIAPPKPKYPPEAYRAHEQGTVMVRADVDALGNVTAVDVVKRSGSRVLDRAAATEVRNWKFTPALRGGKAVASTIQVPVDYRLDDRQ